VVPGNHDVPLYNLLGRFLRPFAKYHLYISPMGLPANLFTDEELAVLGLNTARRFTRKNGRVSLEQMDQIARVFCDLPRGVFKVLVTHHPLGVPDGETQLQLAGRSALALETIHKAGVHLLLSGHHHRALSGYIGPQIGSKGSVLIVHAGTAISSRTRGAEGNTYNLIRIDGERLTVTVMEWRAGCGFRGSQVGSYLFQDGQWGVA